MRKIKDDFVTNKLLLVLVFKAPALLCVSQNSTNFKDSYSGESPYQMISLRRNLTKNVNNSLDKRRSELSSHLRPETYD